MNIKPVIALFAALLVFSCSHSDRGQQIDKAVSTDENEVVRDNRNAEVPIIKITDDPNNPDTPFGDKFSGFDAVYCTIPNEDGFYEIKLYFDGQLVTVLGRVCVGYRLSFIKERDAIVSTFLETEKTVFQRKSGYKNNTAYAEDMKFSTRLMDKNNQSGTLFETQKGDLKRICQHAYRYPDFKTKTYIGKGEIKAFDLVSDSGWLDIQHWKPTACREIDIPFKYTGEYNPNLEVYFGADPRCPFNSFSTIAKNTDKTKPMDVYYTYIGSGNAEVESNEVLDPNIGGGKGNLVDCDMQTVDVIQIDF